MESVFFAFTILGGALFPSLFWLWFFLREDTHRESARFLVSIFAAGALVSLPVLGLQLGYQEALGSLADLPAVVFLGLALIEEALKFAAVFAVAHRDRAFHGPIDAMVVMVVGAIGFTTVENLLIMGSALTDLGGSSLTGAAEALAIRAIGATLLHALASAIVGYAWARGRIAAMASGVEPSAFAETSSNHRPQSDVARPFLRWVLPGIAAATALHAVFNYLVFSFKDESLLYPTLLLILVSFLVFRDFESLKPKG